MQTHQYPGKLFTIALRIKPTSTLSSFCNHVDSNSIILKKTNEVFQFDHIFDQSSTSQDIHSNFSHIIDDFFNGINGNPIALSLIQSGCICAYGQTSSGKTYTMKGTPLNPGIIPLTFSYIFQNQLPLQKLQTIRISYLEIYNEQIYDLLSDNKNQIDIKSQFLANELEIHNYEQFQSIYEFGENQRQYGSTRLNENSSRSHVILSLKTQYSELVLADLAGSENVNKVSAVDSRRKESLMINRSLLALQTVVAKLRENRNQYVNFRDSKLTRILQNNLTGNSQTIILFTVNPSEENLNETINTLRFGVNVGAVKSIRQSTPSKLNDRLSLQTELNIAMEKIKELENETLEQQVEIKSLKAQNIIYKNQIQQDQLLKDQQKSINSQSTQRYCIKLDYFSQDPFNLLDFDTERMFSDQQTQTDIWDSQKESFYKSRISQIEKEISQLERQYEQHLFQFNLELEQITENDHQRDKTKYLEILKDNSKKILQYILDCLKNECLQKTKQIYLLTLALQDKKEQLTQEKNVKYKLEKKMYEMHSMLSSRDNSSQKISLKIYNADSIFSPNSKKISKKQQN